jgi:Holliday junction resolvase
MSEKALQTKCIKFLESQGWYVIKIVVASKSGVPDLICCSPAGKFYGFEIKENSKPTALQMYNINRINEVNGKAYLIYSLSELEDIVFNPK